ALHGALLELLALQRGRVGAPPADRLAGGADLQLFGHAFRQPDRARVGGVAGSGAAGARRQPHQPADRPPPHIGTGRNTPWPSTAAPSSTARCTSSTTATSSPCATATCRSRRARSRASSAPRAAARARC